jgi:carboxypeptidase family protein
VSAAPKNVRRAGFGLLVAAAIVAAITLSAPFGDGPASREDARQGAEAGSGPEPPPVDRGRVAKPPAKPGPGRVVGYARDVNGNPVPGARVRVGGTPRGTRADSQGRYDLRLPRGARTLLAEHPAYATQAVELSEQAVRGQRLDFSLAATHTGRTAAPNSADELIFWVDCSQLAEVSAAELNRLIADGIDGFVCMAGRLHTMGGVERFTGELNAGLDGAGLDGADYELQRSLRGSALVKLAGRGRLRLYLGFKAADYYNPRTPFKEWFDDAAWSREVLTPVRDLAAAARSLGFAGVALDQELYPGSRGARTASWDWDYPSNERPETKVRAQVERRGRQLMTAMLAGYPGLELVAYNTMIPGTWVDKVHEVVNDQRGVYADDVRVDLWAGLSSVPGYAAIRWFDSIFYKSPHIGGDWSVALEDNANSTYSVLSRRFPNWRYASSRLHVTPFSWIDEGPRDSEYDDAREPAYVADQLAAFRTWGTGGTFGNFTYGEFADFDHEPYVDAMRTASTPGTVDQQTPDIAVKSPAGEGTIDASDDQLNIAGTAHDNFAIRVVRWYDAKDRFGTAELTWHAEDSLSPDETWPTRWRIRGVPLSPGTNRITVVAEDIKGLATVRTLTVRR